MDIRVIRYFLEVAEELNITKAAENLNMAQPPLSRQMQLLEEELGVKLFNREKRRLQLTEEGELLKHRGEQILSLVEKTEEEVQEMKHGVSGTLYIGSVEGRGPHILAKWIAGFSKKYPQVQYNLWNGSTDDVNSRLSKGLSDFSVVIEPYDTENFSSIAIRKEPWIAMIPADHPLAKEPGGTIALKKLVGEPLLIPSRKSRIQEIQNLFSQIGEEATVLCELSHFLNAYELTLQGVGIAIFPTTSNSIAEGEKVIIKEIVDPSYMASYVLLWDKNRKLSIVAEKFLEFVQEESRCLN